MKSAERILTARVGQERALPRKRFRLSTESNILRGNVNTTNIQMNTSEGRQKNAFWSASVAKGALSLLVLVPSIAFGADAPGPNSDSQIEEIVVTAEKRSENLQKAPVSVDVLTPSAIADAGIKNAFDLQEVLPTVKFLTSDVTTVAIRGLGTNNVNAGVDPSIAYSVDGIYLSHYEALPPVLFDLQRIEALLGPQGTLYGRNSNGGVINFISNNPSDKFEGNASFQVGDYGLIGSEAMINVPISDTLAVRAALGTEKHDGYNSDGSDDANAIAGRVKLAYTPSTDLSVLLSVDASERTPQGQGYSQCPPQSNYPVCQGVKFQPWGGEGTAQKADYNDTYVFGTSGQVDYNLGWAGLTSLTGFRLYHFHALTSSPADGSSPLQLGINYYQDESDYFFTQELRLASEPESTVKWVAGLYYSDETQPADVRYDFDFLKSLGAPAEILDFPINQSSYRSKAAFGDVTYPIFDNLRIRLGARYTEEQKSAYGTASTASPDGAFPTSFLATGGSEKLDRFTWKTGLDYDLTPENLLYFTASSGFKSGGVNQVPAALPQSYGPEKIVAYELGSKNRFFDGAFQVDADVFHYDYNGYQAYFGFVYNGSTVFATVNSQTATFEGGDLDAIWRVTPDDTVTFNAEILHDIFNSFVIPGQVDVSGHSVPDSPHFSYGASYKHSFDLPNEDVLSIQVNTELVGGHYTWYTEAQGSYQPTYHRSGADLTYDTADGGWTFTAYIRNIENAAVINTWSIPYPDIVGPGAGKDLAFVDPPRTFGFIVKKSFGGSGASSAPYSPPPAPPAAVSPAPPAAAAAPEAQRSFQVFFDFDKSTITDAAARVIGTAADVVKTGGIARVVVTGHTDTVGTGAYNQALSERRAAAVKQQLISDGIAAGEIATLGVGKAGLLVPTADGVREPQNRRAEIVLQ